MTTHAPSPSVIKLSSCTSTNTYINQHLDTMPHGTVVSTHTQSAGRGQRGNSWEAAPGLNITMSMLLRPRAISPRNQFYISEMVALATVGMLREAGAADVSIKWPNDIYAGDLKICGILIEHILSATAIDATIAGIGVNINQPRFVSDAPNPVSLLQLTGREHDVDRLTIDLAARILSYMSLYDTADAPVDELHARFLDNLWRNDGELHSWIDTATSSRFMASIKKVEPSGMLHLVTRDGDERVYAFKEVAAIL